MYEQLSISKRKPHRSALLALAIALQILGSGCANANQYHSKWDLRQAEVSSPQDQQDSQAALTRSENAHQLRIGMSKQQIREIAGSLLDEQNDDIWELNGQFTPVTLGLYPYFDDRHVYLYFDENSKLAAIIQRGVYTVYP